MSLVKTPEARPYSVALALRITPSISLREERKIGEEGHEPRHHTQMGCTKLQLWYISMQPSLSSPVLECGDDHDWPEGLFLCNEHTVIHVSEDGGLHKES